MGDRHHLRLIKESTLRYLVGCDAQPGAWIRAAARPDLVRHFTRHRVWLLRGNSRFLRVGMTAWQTESHRPHE